MLSVILLLVSARAFSPDAESMLEHLREGIASGSATEEAFTAFLDRVALGDEGDGGDCRAWASMPEMQSEALRFAGLREALAEVCPASDLTAANDGPEVAGRAASWDAKASARREQLRSARLRISVSQSVRPRRDPAPTGWDRLSGEGVFSGGALRTALAEDGRPDQRLLRLGSARVALFAGQFHPALQRTRLDFVAGGRFYAGRSGTSGVSGPWEARTSALDGLAVSAMAGRWIAEAAGAWNRMSPRAGEAGPGPDALLYQFGIALPARLAPRKSPRRGEYGEGRESGESGGNGLGLSGLGLRLQVLHVRGESQLAERSAPVNLTVAGVGLESAWDGVARWSLGLAGSRIGPPQGLPTPSGPGEAGGYAEAALASPIALNSASGDPGTDGSGTGGEPDPAPPGGPSAWRLEARQATEAWANPLQSPRGILRDTAGGWNLPGRGEGAAAAQGSFPFATRGAWGMALRSGLQADWSSTGGLLAQSGSLGISQLWGGWTGETGTALRWRRSGTGSAAEGAALAGEAALADDPGGKSVLGWGQNLGWRQGVWRTKAAFTWKGEGYTGVLPASLSLEAGRSADTRRNRKAESGSGFSPGMDAAWSIAVLTGDIRNPGSYLRADVRESWKLGGRLKAEQVIRLPWTREGLGADLSYQLRVEAAL